MSVSISLIPYQSADQLGYDLWTLKSDSDKMEVDEAGPSSVRYDYKMRLFIF